MKFGIYLQYQIYFVGSARCTLLFMGKLSKLSLRAYSCHATYRMDSAYHEHFELM